MSKRVIICLVALAAIAVATISVTVAAPSAIAYSSTFQLRNLGGVTATVSIAYYDRSTGNVSSTFNTTIGPNASRTFATVAQGLPAGSFDGSAVVSSDQQLVAIVNLAGNPGGNALQYFDTTPGASVGATTLNLPLVMRGNFGYDTFFNVQNAGSANTDIHVTYSNGSTESATGIVPGQSARFDQSGNGGLPSTFVGSATVTGTQPLAATLMQVGSGTLKTMMGYNGFTTSGTSVNLPLIAANNFGFYTSFQVQNTGNTTATVTATWGTNNAGAFVPVAEQKQVGAGKSVTFLQRNGQWGTYQDNTKKYVGSATLTTANSMPLVVIVNQQCFAGTVGASCNASVASTYTGFNSGTGTASATLPLIMANNSNYYTSFQVQNVGSGNCTTIAATYSNNTASAFSPVQDSVSNVAVGASKTIQQRSGQWGTYPDNTKKYVGSANVVGSGAGCQIAVIVNQQNLLQSGGDQFSTYNGFNY